MKRYLLLAVLVGVLAVFGAVSVVSAQDDVPTPPQPGQGFGRMGMMGSANGYGPMHEYMEAALAEQLGLTEEELEERHANGETFWQIAEEQGYTTEEAQQMMVDARNVALDKMVADGTLTEEQAEWMKSRSNRMMGGQGRGAGGCMGGRGRWTQDT